MTKNKEIISLTIDRDIKEYYARHKEINRSEDINAILRERLDNEKVYRLYKKISQEMALQEEIKVLQEEIAKDKEDYGKLLEKAGEEEVERIKQMIYGKTIISPETYGDKQWEGRYHGFKNINIDEFKKIFRKVYQER
jgi:hypothetical protein